VLSLMCNSMYSTHLCGKACAFDHRREGSRYSTTLQNTSHYPETVHNMSRCRAVGTTGTQGNWQPRCARAPVKVNSLTSVQRGKLGTGADGNYTAFCVATSSQLCSRADLSAAAHGVHRAFQTERRDVDNVRLEAFRFFCYPACGSSFLNAFPQAECQ
jgi:hypothetical protein